MARLGNNGAGLGNNGAAPILSAIFAPDPVIGFPPGSIAGDFSLSGILHLVFGAISFAAIAAAAFAHASWSRGIDAKGRAAVSVILGVVVLVGFFVGAALSGGPAGVALLKQGLNKKLQLAGVRTFESGVVVLSYTNPDA